MAYNGFTRREVLKYAALAEVYSKHPIAEAIRKAVNNEVRADEVKTYWEALGYGVEAKVEGTAIIVGNEKFLLRRGIKCSLPKEVRGTTVHVAINGVYAGYIVISDKVRDDALQALKMLRKLGIRKLIMVTGDNRYVASRVAKQLGMDEYYAELLPEGKVKLIEEGIPSYYHPLGFVGDGVNDAPVIARADVGIAMGALGSDAAIEIADVVIMDN